MANYNLTHTWQQVDDATGKILGIPDYIIGTGTDSNNWKWVKYDSGRMTAVRRIYYSSVTFTASTGGGYASMSQITMPAGLIEAPDLVATSIDSTGYISVSFGSVTATQATPRICRLFSSSSTLVRFSVILEGRWK